MITAITFAATLSIMIAGYCLWMAIFHRVASVQCRRDHRALTMRPDRTRYLGSDRHGGSMLWTKPVRARRSCC